MTYRMNLIVKAETAVEATRYLHERMIPLHFNPNIEVKQTSAPHQWVVRATCAREYDPTHLLNEWFMEDNGENMPTYPFGSLLFWGKEHTGELITLEFSQSELVGLYISLRDGGDKNRNLIHRVERIMDENRINWSEGRPA